MTLRHAPLPASRLIVAVVVAVLLAQSAGASTAAAASPAPPATLAPRAGEVIPGRVIVRFDQQSTEAEKGRARTLVAGEKIRGSKLVKGLEVVSTTLDTDAALRKLRATKGVLYAEPDRVIAMDAVPDDPSFPQLWGLQEVNAPAAWDVTTGEGAVVAVIDTGVAMDHPDLAANVWTNGDETPNGLDDDDNGFVDDIHGWDFTQGDADPTDQHGHGTHVAGTIGAVGNNGIGVIGVAPSSSIMPIRVLGANGQGSISHGIAGIEYAWRNGADVANLSWGFPGGVEQPLKDVIDAAGANGMVVVAAAGNNAADIDADPVYPAAFDLPGLITVAAINPNGNLASFSNYGLANVDLAAPGVTILSTVPGGYGSAQGTSMAAPHVSGAAALLAAAHPAWSAATIRARLLATATPAFSLAGVIGGGGTVDVAAALTPPADASPVIKIASPANNSTRLPGSLISFSATATDSEDGNVGPSISWASNLQGLLGTGPMIQRDDLVAGTHLITATASDGTGHTPSKAITLTIGPTIRQVASGPTNESPVIAVRPDGTVDIAYQRYGTGTRLATKVPAGSWATRKVGDSQMDRWVDMAIDPTGQPVIAVQREWSSVGVWEDAGIVAYEPAGAGFSQERITDSCQDNTSGCHEDWKPRLAFDTAGREHVVFFRTGTGVYHARRTSNGAWALEHLTTAFDVMDQAVAIGPSNSVHVAYVRGGVSAPGVYHATNAGGTWVTTQLSTSAQVNAVGIVVEPLGRVRVVTATDTGVRLRTRTGTTWGAWSTLTPVRSASIDVARDAANRLHIAFGRLNASDEPSGISYLTDKTGSWVATSLAGTTRSVEPSIGLDSLGRPHVAWREEFPTPRIRYATNATGSWITATVASSFQYRTSQLAIDTTGTAHVASARIGTSPGMYYGTDDGGTWSLARISSEPPLFEVGLATDAAGKAHVVYAEFLRADNTVLANPGVYYATNAGGSWIRTKIGEPGDGGPIVIDAAGHAHVAFLGFDGPGRTGTFGVRYATNASGTWVSQRVITGGFSEPTIALDPSGKVHVAAVLREAGQHRIFYASNATGSWTSAQLTSGNFDARPSIAIRPGGQPSVSYSREGYGVRLAEKSGATWAHRDVFLNEAVDFTELVIDPDGERHVLISSSNLDYSVCEIPLCPEYPGVRHAIGGDSGAFTIERVTFVGDDAGTDLERAPDGSLRALIERNHAGLVDATIEGPSPD